MDRRLLENGETAGKTEYKKSKGAKREELKQGGKTDEVNARSAGSREQQRGQKDIYKRQMEPGSKDGT
jgi:hypothetical protein